LTVRIEISPAINNYSSVTLWMLCTRDVKLLQDTIWTPDCAERRVKAADSARSAEEVFTLNLTRVA
jgi:hypothetical protein